MQKYALSGENGAGSLIGEGAYGSVIKAIAKDTGRVVAIKRFKEGEEEALVQKTSMREVKVLRALREQPYIVNLIEAFRRKGRLYLVFDYVGKNLLEVLEERPNGLSEPEIRRMIFTTLMALHSCHVNGVLHRDVKVENLLVRESDGTCVLCDYGFARFLHSGNNNAATPAAPNASSAPSSSAASATAAAAGSTATDGSGGGAPAGSPSTLPPSPPGHPQDLTDYVATRWYRAPELLLGTTNYGFPADIWAVGCIMAEMIDGQPLFPAETEYDQLRLISKGLGPLTDWQYDVFERTPRFKGNALSRTVRSERIVERKYEARISKAAMQVLRALLQVDPAKRPTVVQALQMPWFDGLAAQYCPPGFRLGVPTVVQQSGGAVAATTSTVAATPAFPLAAVGGARPASGAPSSVQSSSGRPPSKLVQQQQQHQLVGGSGQATPVGSSSSPADVMLGHHGLHPHHQQQQQQQHIQLPESSISYYQQQLNLGPHSGNNMPTPQHRVPPIGSGRSGTPDQQQQQQQQQLRYGSGSVVMPDIRAPSSVVMGARQNSGVALASGSAAPSGLNQQMLLAQQQQQQQQPSQFGVSPIMMAGGGIGGGSASGGGVPPRGSSGHGKYRTPINQTPPTGGGGGGLHHQQQPQMPPPLHMAMLPQAQQPYAHYLHQQAPAPVPQSDLLPKIGALPQPHHHHHQQLQQQQHFVNGGAPPLLNGGRQGF